MVENGLKCMKISAVLHASRMPLFVYCHLRFFGGQLDFSPFSIIYEKSPRYHSGSQLLSHVKVTTTFILYIVQLSSKVYFVEMYFAEVYFQKCISKSVH